MPRQKLLVAVGIILASAMPAPMSARGAERPNIVLIMSDDMGWSDLGCFGSGLETPNLDALAADGLRFTQFYNTGRCCPTRASLLTGLYPHQAGIGWMMRDTGHPGYSGGLNEHCVTIAQVMSSAGYRTYMTGKWHVTHHTGPDGPKFNWPLQRGFDRFYGTIHGAGSYYDPSSLTRGNTQISPYDDPVYDPETYYYTRAISENAAKFIEDHRQDTSEEPFFLYVAYTCAHWPMHALPQDIARFKGKFHEGYAAIRKARYERQKKMGLIGPDWELSSQPIKWEDVEHKKWEQRCMETYAAAIYRMDVGIGKIVQTLKETGQFENTLILFLEDNGGCAEGTGRRGNKRHPNIPRPEEPSLKPIADEAVRHGGSIPSQTRDGYPVRMGFRAMPGPKDTYVAYGKGWANVSDTPFRLYKHYVHEGGISTPLIAHWPRGIHRDGELESTPGHLIDIMATCADLANADYPEKLDGKTIYPMEGESLVPLFQGKSLEKRALYWEHEGNRAVRLGQWKLVAKGAAGAWELYNMKTDRTEMHNLADEHPDLVKELAAKWHAYAARAHVLPVGAWRLPSIKRRNEKFSGKHRFELSGKGSLGRHQAPYLPFRGFAVAVTFSELGNQGVIAAQGGSARGFSLYQKNGKLFFSVRNGKGIRTIGPVQLPEGTDSVTAVVRPDRSGLIKADGKVLAERAQLGHVDRMPIDGLQIGRDAGGSVADYGGDDTYDGTVEKVVIETNSPAWKTSKY